MKIKLFWFHSYLKMFVNCFWFNCTNILSPTSQSEQNSKKQINIYEFCYQHNCEWSLFFNIAENSLRIFCDWAVKNDFFTLKNIQKMCKVFQWKNLQEKGLIYIGIKKTPHEVGIVMSRISWNCVNFVTYITFVYQVLSSQFCSESPTCWIKLL